MGRRSRSGRPHSPGSSGRPKQSAFIDEYLIDMNATAAYKRAGYTSTGKAAEANASRLIGSDKVKAELSCPMEERAEKVERPQNA